MLAEMTSSNRRRWMKLKFDIEKEIFGNFRRWKETFFFWWCVLCFYVKAQPQIIHSSVNSPLVNTLFNSRERKKKIYIREMYICCCKMVCMWFGYHIYTYFIAIFNITYGESEREKKHNEFVCVCVCHMFQPLLCSRISYIFTYMWWAKLRSGGFFYFVFFLSSTSSSCRFIFSFA